jgi:hypothetical protein
MQLGAHTHMRNATFTQRHNIFISAHIAESPPRASYCFFPWRMRRVITWHLHGAMILLDVKCKGVWQYLLSVVFCVIEKCRRTLYTMYKYKSYCVTSVIVKYGVMSDNHITLEICNRKNINTLRNYMIIFRYKTYLETWKKKI